MVTEKEPEKHEEVEDSGEAGENQLSEKEALEQEVNSLKKMLLKLEQSLKEKDDEITSLKETLDGARQTIDELGQALSAAVATYKETVVGANPGLLPEMITGDTIEEIDASVKKARAVMEKVRQEMEAEAAKTRIPSGAPPRSAPDLSALSPREKIKYAIEGG
jgi:DNA repair exonuclease SbcCD ATPase subunit